MLANVYHKSLLSSLFAIDEEKKKSQSGAAKNCLDKVKLDINESM